MSDRPHWMNSVMLNVLQGRRHKNRAASQITLLLNLGDPKLTYKKYIQVKCRSIMLQHNNPIFAKLFCCRFWYVRIQWVSNFCSWAISASSTLLVFQWSLRVAHIPKSIFKPVGRFADLMKLNVVKIILRPTLPIPMHMKQSLMMIKL